MSLTKKYVFVHRKNYPKNYGIWSHLSTHFTTVVRLLQSEITSKIRIPVKWIECLRVTVADPSKES